MMRLNIKRNYFLPDFLQLSKQMLLFIAVGDDIQM